MKEKIILLGRGGHAKSVVDVIEASGNYTIIGFIDKAEERNFEYRGYSIIGCDADLLKFYKAGIHHAFVCIGFLGQGNIRDLLYDRLKQIGYHLPVLTDPTAVLASDVQVGEGSFIGKRDEINSGAAIGKMAIINTSAVVEHDSKVGGFSHISVNSTLCGEVSVGKKCFVGAGSTIVQGIKIGNNCLIGAGSVVLKDVMSGKKVYGIVKENG